MPDLGMLREVLAGREDLVVQLTRLGPNVRVVRGLIAVGTTLDSGD